MSWLGEVIAAVAVVAGPGAVLGGGPRSVALARAPAQRLLRAPDRAWVTLSAQPGVGVWEVPRPAWGSLRSAELEGRRILGLGPARGPLPCDLVLAETAPPGHRSLGPGLWVPEGQDALASLAGEVTRDPFAAVSALAPPGVDLPVFGRDGALTLSFDPVECLASDDPDLRLGALVSGRVPGAGANSAPLVLPLMGTGTQRLSVWLRAAARPQVGDLAWALPGDAAPGDAPPRRVRPDAGAVRPPGMTPPPAPVWAQIAPGAWLLAIDCPAGPPGRQLGLCLSAPGLVVERIALALPPLHSGRDRRRDPFDPLAAFAPGAW